MPETILNDSDSTEVTVTIFNTFAFLGVFLNAAVLAPVIFSPNVRRRTVWSGLILSWIIYSMSYLLIVGRQLEVQAPPFGLCFLQAVLLYASPMLCILSYTCFTVDLFLQLSAIIFGNRTAEFMVRWTKVLVILPWVGFVGVIMEVFLVVHDPSVVQRTPGRFYCHLTNSLP
ncbi:hypothetical protein FPV67DRAFT_1227160 [Lyophyllum atratum]|nr:hypothetical protein FPV67DRAFT_1227160 [Lyophyllum atratum]